MTTAGTVCLLGIRNELNSSYSRGICAAKNCWLEFVCVARVLLRQTNEILSTVIVLLTQSTSNAMLGCYQACLIFK